MKIGPCQQGWLFHGSQFKRTLNVYVPLFNYLIFTVCVGTNRLETLGSFISSCCTGAGELLEILHSFLFNKLKSTKASIWLLALCLSNTMMKFLYTLQTRLPIVVAIPQEAFLALLRIGVKKEYQVLVALSNARYWYLVLTTGHTIEGRIFWWTDICWGSVDSSFSA